MATAPVPQRARQAAVIEQNRLGVLGYLQAVRPVVEAGRESEIDHHPIGDGIVVHTFNPGGPDVMLDSCYVQHIAGERAPAGQAEHDLLSYEEQCAAFVQVVSHSQLLGLVQPAKLAAVPDDAKPLQTGLRAIYAIRAAHHELRRDRNVVLPNGVEGGEEMLLSVAV